MVIAEKQELITLREAHERTKRLVPPDGFKQNTIWVWIARGYLSRHVQAPAPIGHRAKFAVLVDWNELRHFIISRLPD